MAEAIYALATGLPLAHNEPSGPEVPNEKLRKADGWKTIINLDIKDQNVVLGDPVNGTPAYKSAKMIDFGHCIDDPSAFTPDIRMTMGTDGFMPPVCSFHGHLCCYIRC
jgi:serine/threonine protein kinase